MVEKFSAYLSIYNDWDILPETLRSIAPQIDELVVVDGAYQWMAPYVQAIGHDPLKSDRRVYRALEEAGIPFRVISQLWRSEIEKRKAGYLTCSNRYIYRIDADEVYFFNEVALNSFLSNAGGVAEMEMPLYAFPGWFVADESEARIGRQGFLFDTNKIDADRHLSYLWLVLTVDQLPVGPPSRIPVFPEPIAFNAHLSNWRTPTTGVNRAAFYMLNWIRAHGAPWFNDLKSRPLDDLSPLFARISPTIFLDALKGHGIVMGHEGLGARVFRRSPLPPADEQKFAFLFDQFLAGHARANAELRAVGRYMLGNGNIDLSSAGALRALTSDTRLNFRLGSKIVASTVALRYLLPSDPWQVDRPVSPDIDGRQMSFELPSAEDEPRGWLRRILTLALHDADGAPVKRLECC